MGIGWVGTESEKTFRYKNIFTRFIEESIQETKLFTDYRYYEFKSKYNQ